MIQPNNFILVDDDDTNNILCSLTIRKAFGDVAIQSFTNPVVALQHIGEHCGKSDAPHSILFLDLNMPEMTGWEFLDAFSEFGEAVRTAISIYIMSSSLDIRDREKAASISHVSKYFAKPITVPVLQRLFTPDAIVAG